MAHDAAVSVIVIGDVAGEHWRGLPPGRICAGGWCSRAMQKKGMQTNATQRLAYISLSCLRGGRTGQRNSLK